VLGLVEPDAGNVEFLDTRWNGNGVSERSRRDLRPRLQYIPQDPLSSFDPRHSVRPVAGRSVMVETFIQAGVACEKRRAA
jgi:peptide/nickel transport system ATP-binding protein